jgi:N-dimethylarginine dimethylaminohydrolase
MGDGLWHPKRKLLWGGYGFRTAQEAYDEIGKIFGTPVVLLELAMEEFYHLDTCLMPLSESEALFFPGAFKPEGRRLIQALFSEAIEVPEKEALEGFALNGVVVDKKVLIQRGNSKTNQLLKERGYEPIELDTSEFMKSGGSAFCMKMMVYG